MSDDRCGAPCSAWLGVLAAFLSSSCESDQPASPTPSTPDAPAFVHVLDPGQPQRYQQVLSTFRADPRTGGLSVVDTKAVPNYSSSPLAADPRGRFVYVNEDAGPHIGDGSFRSYRVDATSGSLTLASEAPMKGLGVHHVRTLAASAGRLYFGGDYWWGTSNWDNVLGVLAVSGSGVLSDGKTLISDWDDTGSFRELLAVEAEQDLVLAGYRWDYDLHALAVDVPPAGSPGYRDVARLELHEAGGGPEPPVTTCIAASGRVFFIDEGGGLLSFVLHPAEGRFEERGAAPDAGEPGASVALAAPDRLAVVTPAQSVPYTYAERQYSHQTKSIAIYGVGADGGLSLLSALPESYFVSGPTLAFHPSGSFLYACGAPSDGSPWGSVLSKAQYLLTFSVGEDGAMALFGALPVAGCGPMVVTAPTS